MADKHELPYSFISDGEPIDYILYGKTNSLKEQFYDTSHPRYTLNITNGQLASDNNAAVTPYYEIPNSTGFFAVRFDACGVVSWDYINLCVYELSGSTYIFKAHVYPIKTITSESGYITKIFYCKYSSTSNKIVCRFVVPVGIINDGTKFDIYTGVGDTPKMAELYAMHRDDINIDTVTFVAVGELEKTHQLYFRSKAPMKSWLTYGYWDGTTYTRITNSEYVTLTDPYELVFPEGANAARGSLEDANNQYNNIYLFDIYDIRIIEKNKPVFNIPLEITDGSSTTDYSISLDLPLRTGDELVYADQQRIDSDDTETEMELPEITPYIGINTLSVNTDIAPSLEIVGEEEDDKKRPSGDIATVHKVIEYFNVYNTEYVGLLNAKNIEYLIRIELLDNYETTLGEITRALSAETQGQINVNYNQITRRSCSFSVANVEQKYIPSESNPFWVNRKFRLWIGVYQRNVQSEDKIYWWSQGVFVCKDANADAHIVNITGVDKGGLLDGTLKVNMSEKQYKFFVGENVPLVIRDILMFNMGLNVIDEDNKYGGGQPIDPIPPLVDTKYRFTRLEQDVYVDINNYLSQMIESIADGIGADAYYDTNGRFQVVPTPDATRLDGYKYVASQWDFTDLSAFYSNVNYQYNFDGINYVNVYTNSSTKENVSYTAINDNPLSPLQIRTVGLKKAENREIDYFETVNGDMITKDAMKEYCRQSARAQLYRESMIGMSLSFNAPIIPHMDVGRTISVSDKYQDIENGIFVVQSITFPLSGDAMQINATNINWLPLDKDMEGVDI